MSRPWSRVTNRGIADELAPFVLHNVEGLKDDVKEAGLGAYGVIFKVTVNDLEYVAKRLHKALVDDVQNSEDIQKKFRNECITLSQLHHPNIVHFIGVHYGRKRTDLSLIMEYIPADLSGLLETHPQIPLSLKLSILLDVSYGLLYLHTRDPAIVHRDLTARNVLITSDGCAKIADLGVAKLLTAQALMALNRHTKAPGQPLYMPPEALTENPACTPKIDIFSFGHLSLFTINQEFPDVFEVNVTPKAQKQGRIQAMKRRVAILQLGEDHCMYPLIIQCIHDNPIHRPSTVELTRRMHELCTKHPKRMEDIVTLDDTYTQQIETLATTLNASVEERDTLQSSLKEMESTYQKQISDLQAQITSLKETVATMKLTPQAIATQNTASSSLSPSSSSVNSGTTCHEVDIMVTDYDRGVRSISKPLYRRERSMSEKGKSRYGVYNGDEQIVVIVPQPELCGATTDLYRNAQTRKRVSNISESLYKNPSVSDTEREIIFNMSIGMEKIQLASKKKVAIKFFVSDGVYKTVVVEERMTAAMVCHLLVVKNHFSGRSSNWVLVEQLGDVNLERELEDHECVVTIISTWPRNHKNMFLLKQNEKKYDLFEDPIKYFPENHKFSQTPTGSPGDLERAENAKAIVLRDFISFINYVPELEGFLHLKDGYRKGWRKVYCILRASGLYYSTKEKANTFTQMDLMALFDKYQLYRSIKHETQALDLPTEHCFALRPIPIGQEVPGPNDTKMLCCDDEQTALSWIAGIRLAKYSHQLRENFHKSKLTLFKLEEDLTAPVASRQKVRSKSAHKIPPIPAPKPLFKKKSFVSQQQKQHLHVNKRMSTGLTYNESPSLSAHQATLPQMKDLTAPKDSKQIGYSELESSP